MLSEWLRSALASTGTKQAALARALTTRLGKSIDRAAVNKMVKGTRRISAEEMLAISEFLGVPTPEVESRTALQIPILSWVSAGDLKREDYSHEVLGFQAVADLPDGDWIALRVTGDSMDRISPPESVIIINRRDTRLVANACYVIADTDGSATYKRFRPQPSRFEPVSTNPDHEPIFPENEPQIVGRVRLSILHM